MSQVPSQKWSSAPVEQSHNDDDAGRAESWLLQPKLVKRKLKSPRASTGVYSTDSCPKHAVDHMYGIMGKTFIPRRAIPHHTPINDCVMRQLCGYFLEIVCEYLSKLARRAVNVHEALAHSCICLKHLLHNTTSPRCLSQPLGAWNGFHDNQRLKVPGSTVTRPDKSVAKLQWWRYKMIDQYFAPINAQPVIPRNFRNGNHLE